MRTTGYSTDVYYYTPRNIVVVYTGSSPRRFNQMYTKNLRLHKGVDNRIQFRFLDQQQKAVDVTDKDLIFRFMNREGTKVLFEKSLTMLLPANGIVELQVSANDLSRVDAQLGQYSLEIPMDQFNLPVFVDDYSGGRGVMEVVDSIHPKFMQSRSLVIPSHPVPKDCCAVADFYTSMICTYDACCTTLQLYFENFSGTVQVKGCTLPAVDTDPDWYDIGEPYELVAQTTPIGITIDGHHPYIMMKITKYTSGDITKILYR